MKLIQINYLDKNDQIISNHKTGDEWTAKERAAWEEWLNDNAVEHPDAPENGWISFKLVSYVEQIA